MPINKAGPDAPVTHLQLALAMEHIRGYIIKQTGAQVANLSGDFRARADALQEIFKEDEAFVTAIDEITGRGQWDG